ncbi:MND1-interacting protein 1-like [Wolffia australiana]
MEINFQGRDEAPGNVGEEEDEEDDEEEDGESEGASDYWTEEKMEKLLIKNLKQIYKDAIDRLISLGYHENLAFSAVIRSGDCFGRTGEIFSDIIENAVSEIDSVSGFNSSFDLRHLVKSSLDGLIRSLRQARPDLTRGDAMWCLLMCELGLRRASAIDLTVDVPTDAGGGDLDEDIEAEIARRFGLTPAAESRMRRQVAMFEADFGSRSGTPPISTVSDGGSSSLSQFIRDHAGPDAVAELLDDFKKLTVGGDSVSEDPEERKRDMIEALVGDLNRLEESLKERIEWAQRKVLEAAEKLNKELSEERNLRQDWLEKLHGGNDRKMMDDSLIKKVEDMDDHLKKAEDEVDEAIRAVRKLNKEYKDLFAEMEGLGWSPKEMTPEELKLEKLMMKKIDAWDKQREDMKNEIQRLTASNEKSQQESENLTKKKKELEMSLSQAVTAREMAVTRAEKARRAKEFCKSSIKTRRKELRKTFDNDAQRHRNQIQALKEELARLKGSPMPRSPIHHAGPSSPSRGTLELRTRQPAAPAGNTRECLTCNSEVSVVFLPCAHQVFCTSCSDHHEHKATMVVCPICSCRIRERIKVLNTIQ